MKMKTILPSILAAMFCGCAHVAPEASVDPQVTCKPKFEVRERHELHVMDSEGRERTAYRQWLILEDGNLHVRIPWGAPPLSRPPVELYTHQTYTFTVTQQAQIPKLIRIRKDQEVIYEAPQ
jgi:hypothetical protein